MYRGKGSRLLPVIMTLLVIAVVVIVVVSVGRAIFGGGGNSSSQTDAGRQALLATSVDHSVRMTVRGPIVANENFHSYQITVSPDSRNLTLYTGYLDQAMDTNQLGNNTKAYEEFVYALDKANLMNGTPLSGDKNDTRGICATGYVYKFETLKSNSPVKMLWTSTCRGSTGSLKASVTQVRNLFLVQIPNSSSTIATIGF